MKRLLLAAAMFFGAESAALACSCLPVPPDQAALRQLADEVAGGAVALVEVDVRSGYNGRTGRGEAMRVRRTFAGRVPRDFHLARGSRPSSAACDVDYRAGSRVMVLLYNAERAARRGPRQYRDAGLCVSMYLHNADFRRMLAEAMGRRGRSGAVGTGPVRPCPRAVA